MSSYWIDFKGASNASVVAEDKEEAREIAERERDEEIRSIKVLPYPAQPCLNKDDWLFCYKPASCAGKTACPRRPACTS